MNYYIQGNKEKADKIKAAFEKLGIDVLDFGFADKTLVYCSIGGCVQCLPYSINLMHILYSHPDYQELELPKPHYDISNFKPFDRVLVRQDDSCTWGVSFFGRYGGMFMCCNNVCFIQCIPFNDDTKHLVGTTNPCDEQYINW